MLSPALCNATTQNYSFYFKVVQSLDSEELSFCFLYRTFIVAFQVFPSIGKSYFGSTDFLTLQSRHVQVTFLILVFNMDARVYQIRWMAVTTPPVSQPAPVATPSSNGSQLSTGVIIGISIGVFIGILIAVCALMCFGCRKKRLEKRNSSHRGFVLPIRVNGVNSSTIMSDSISSPPSYATNKATTWWGHERQLIPSSSGVTKFSYK